MAELFTQLSGVKYRRTPMSGGFRMEFPGDLLKKEQKSSIFDGILLEVKNRKTLAIPEWLREAKVEAIDGGLSKIMVMFKLNGEWFFVFDQKLLENWAKKLKRCQKDE